MNPIYNVYNKKQTKYKKVNEWDNVENIVIPIFFIVLLLFGYFVFSNHLMLVILIVMIGYFAFICYLIDIRKGVYWVKK